MSATASIIAKLPLVKQLIGKANKWKTRTNIISPDLCDDIIRRLGPSLTQHVGCTIIDINPGVGLWSSKLHDHLQPRSHILIEPKADVYLPFLQPLLDAPGSRYCLKHWPDADVWQPNRYVKEGLLHDAEGRGGPPPTTKEPNNSILIIANLAGQRHKSPMEVRATPAAHLKAIDYAHAIRQQSGFVDYGPTRMLMWLADKDKRSLLPRTVGYRGKLAVMMEAHAQLEEIVGFPDASDERIHREDALDIESSKRVARRMQEKNIEIPPHRQARMEDRRYDLSDISRHWHKELQELEEDFRAGKFSQTGEMPQTKDGKVKVRKKEFFTPEYKRMAALRAVSKGENVNIAKSNVILKSQERIDKMDLDLHREDTKPSEKEEITKTLTSSIQDYKNEVEALTHKQRLRLLFLDDDRRVFAMDPSLLMWDQREAEPILPRENEFYTPRQMALLDFEPKATNEYPMTSEQCIYFDMISTSLLSPSGHKTFKHVGTIAPGAFEALVPQIQAIRDPRKGGRYDLESIRIRAATPEMIHGLALAWDNWAFKPPLESSLTHFGNNFSQEVERIGVIVKL